MKIINVDDVVIAAVNVIKIVILVVLFIEFLLYHFHKSLEV